MIHLPPMPTRTCLLSIAITAWIALAVASANWMARRDDEAFAGMCGGDGGEDETEEEGD